MPGSVEGVGDLVARFNRLERDITTRKDVHRDAAEPIFARARSDAPTESGRLRRSGRLRATGKEARVVFGSASVPWAGPAHFGHFNRPQGGFMRPNPFLFDAADTEGDEASARYEAFIDSRIASDF